MALFCVLIAVTIFLLLLYTIIQVYLRLTVGRCTCNVYLTGKTALVTGGNSGLGYQTALALAGKGCRVIIADKDNCDQTKQEIINTTGNSNIVTKNFNLASFKSVRNLAKDINETEERLDILINNAGIGSVGNVDTEDGLNMGMQINHFGPFLLTHLLIGLLKKSAPSRIIFVSSWLAFINNLKIKNLNYPKKPHSSGWSDHLMVYANSKLCNILTAKELSKKLHGTGITANALHPGLVYTPIYEKSHVLTNFQFFLQIFLKLFAKNPQEGAQTTIHLAVAKEIDTISGQFFSDCKPFTQPSKAKDDLFARKIWETSEKCVQLSPDERL